MATYKEITNWVKENYELNIKTCWIANAKEIFGLEVSIAPNRKNKDIRQIPCPPDKLEIIKEAFIHFRMLK